MDLWAAAVVALAAAPFKPLPPRAPERVAPPSLRVHVRAHEDLDPDALRSFARPRVTLWLETRSNALRASTLETLRRFDAVFVHLRGPVSSTQARALDTAPRAGLWLDASQLDAEGVARLLGPRPLAVKLDGPLDEAVFERLQRARPQWVEWAAPAEVDVMSFSLLSQLPGRKVVSGLPARACPGHDDGPAARAHLATLLSLSAGTYPCGRAPVIVVGLETDRWLIQSAVLFDPTAELEVAVGSDELAAYKASRLLDELGVVGPR